MRHCGTQELETRRLLLRRLTVEDTEMMYSNWASDPKVTEYLRWNAHHSWAVTATYLNETIPRYEDEDFYLWGIAEKGTGILFGTISIQRLPRNRTFAWTFCPDSLGEAWEVECCLSRKRWNKGYATEALSAVRDFWFTSVGARWLISRHALENTAPGAVLEKAGFVYDHSGDYYKNSGTPVPCRVYCLHPYDPTLPPAIPPAAEKLEQLLEPSSDASFELPIGQADAEEPVFELPVRSRREEPVMQPAAPALAELPSEPQTETGDEDAAFAIWL